MKLSQTELKKIITMNVLTRTSMGVFKNTGNPDEKYRKVSPKEGMIMRDTMKKIATECA